MKTMKVLPDTDGKINANLIRQINIENIKEIMSHNKEISLDDILQVGVLETGEIQFKVPKSIRDRQVLYLIAYTMWFYGIKPGDLK